MLKKRIITGAFIFLFFLFLWAMIKHHIIFKDNNNILLTLMGIIIIIITNIEMFNMFDKKQKINTKNKFFILMISIITFVFYLNIFLKENIFLNMPKQINNIICKNNNSFILFIILISLMFFVFYNNFNTRELGINFIILNYISIGVSSLLSLVNKKILNNEDHLFNDWLCYVILVAILTDIFAFLIGYYIGRNKIFPKLSPNKTLEGCLAGIIISTFCIMILNNYYFKNSDYNLSCFILTFCSSFISQIGDLINSKFKRNYNIKDFGQIFPGHGGLLDRLDSILFLSIFINCIQPFN